MGRDDDMRNHRKRGSRGQALVEFGLILPVLLTMFGGAVDVARVYQAWITLQGATRDAAEYAATFDTTSAAAQSDAQRLVCTETSKLSGFVAPAGNPTACTTPAVSVTSFTRSATAVGASTRYPIATVTVQATLPFRTLFAYPLFTQNGAWTLTATVTYSIVQGR
jgi:Flp pilus assembly protein TadG